VRGKGNNCWPTVTLSQSSTKQRWSWPGIFSLISLPGTSPDTLSGKSCLAFLDAFPFFLLSIVLSLRFRLAACLASRSRCFSLFSSFFSNNKSFLIHLSKLRYTYINTRKSYDERNVAKTQEWWSTNHTKLNNQNIKRRERISPCMPSQPMDFKFTTSFVDDFHYMCLHIQISSRW